jgi:hypothetical protein
MSEPSTLDPIRPDARPADRLPAELLPAARGVAGGCADAR